MSTPVDENSIPATSWTLIRDLAVLQVKLVVDGFRDLVLLPTSIIAALLSLLRSENGVPGSQFYRLLAVGRQSERWINLFGALKNAPAGVDESTLPGDAGLDDIVARVETFLVDEYQRGGVTAQAKSRIDAALNAMRRKTKKGSEPF